jgi:hypothetical protein
MSLQYCVLPDAQTCMHLSRVRYIFSRGRCLLTSIAAVPLLVEFADGHIVSAAVIALRDATTRCSKETMKDY